MHNGYFKSLKEVVHFYNTRDVLTKCKAGDPGEKVTCWPPPEDPTNLNKRQLGNTDNQYSPPPSDAPPALFSSSSRPLKLTDQAENGLVAFLKTLTDGYKVPVPAPRGS